MRIVRMEVAKKPGVRDTRADALLRDLPHLTAVPVTAVAVHDVYQLAGDLTDRDLRRLGERLLVDPVVEELTVPRPSPTAVDVALLPGVTDTVAETVMEGARLLGVDQLVRVTTGHRYLFTGALGRDDLERVAAELLANPVIQRWSVGAFLPLGSQGLGSSGDAAHIPLRDRDDAGLLAVSRDRRLSLDLAEMRAIRDHFVALGREPTDLELEMLAQTWSEHCVHKTFRAAIDYTERDEHGAVDVAASGRVDGLLKTYIRAATDALDRPWVRSAFVDNAGIVAFDDALDVAFKVETHNHPSALEPFGGANTGVGGVIRDVIGVSARPIAVTDVLCFGPRDTPPEALPAGALHPHRIEVGVVHGVEDYGNKMGIPTVDGAVVYDPGYAANPLVYCGCLGVLPRGSHPTAPQPGDLVVVVGGKTGRDGLRGATFSSMEMDAATGVVSGGAVQIGHPIHEKQALEVVLVARDEGLYNAITDCGAGGLSSAVGEMAEKLGADIELTRVPLKYAGLEPWEIWLSEAQERMVLAVPPDAWPRLSEVARLHAIGCDAIGTFRDDGVLRITYAGDVVGELDTAFLHDGIPRRHLVAEWTRQAPAPIPDGPADVAAALLAWLADPNVASKEDVVRRYDHEVQGGTVVKPLVGPGRDGPGDGAVLVPHEAAEGRVGVALGCGIDPRLGRRDPYAMAWAVVDEAVRNVVAVGADPQQTAILDNFCWGNPLLPDRLGSLVQCCRGCYDAALAYGTPFVSGKDSLNNEWRDANGVSHPIPPTLLVSALGRVPDIGFTATSDAKAAGDALYLVGVTRASELPPEGAPALYIALHGAMRAGLVRACHDLSEGGLLVAAAEMALGGRRGLTVDLSAVPVEDGLRPRQIAFLERPGRLLVEVAPRDVAAFEAALAGHVCARVGAVTDGDALHVDGLEAPSRVPVAALTAAFRSLIDQ
ncbi:MAG: phosphoribosylformylglycinamidine synthase subunit PurL [Deltaproteobacteria bacterium]|nr:MAG: phosphoribosylformylglycinamidine synthase subunit PurL [Deltaproteobacteria bacterium]